MIKLFVKDLVNSYIYELPYVSISFNEEVSVGKDAQIILDLNSVNEISEEYHTNTLFLLTSSTREIWIQKDDSKIYYGIISDFGISKSEQGQYQITLSSVGFFTMFGKRRTGPKRVFSSTDRGAIAWDLINESQLSNPPYSDLGITQGLIQTSKQSDRTYRFDNIKDQILEMTNTNLKDGFDCEIDNSKKFNIFYPQKGTVRSDIVFDDKNISTWQYRKPMTLSLTNKVYVLGEGMNDDIMYVTRESDNVFKSAFGLLEDVVTARDIKTTETLNDKGDRLLLDTQAPIVELQITHLDGQPDILNYDVGDSFRFTISEVGLNLIYKRVTKRTVNISQEGKVTATLTIK